MLFIFLFNSHKIIIIKTFCKHAIYLLTIIIIIIIKAFYDVYSPGMEIHKGDLLVSEWTFASLCMCSVRLFYYMFLKPFQAARCTMSSDRKFLTKIG